MNNATTFVGLDVHARSVKACAFAPETGGTVGKSFGYEPGEIASWAASLPQPAKCVYEPGATGFHLCRELNAMGVDCVVGAVSKMHKPAADRGRKTDRRDARLLAVQLALGVVTEVHVPDPECEGARDPTRASADARDDAVRAKQRLSKFLLRHGFVYDGKNAPGRGGAAGPGISGRGSAGSTWETPPRRPPSTTIANASGRPTRARPRSMRRRSRFPENPGGSPRAMRSNA